jgi:hypothetical protein
MYDMLRLTTILLSACMLFAGCGGAEKQGKSLAQQYSAALQVSDAGLRARRLVGVADKQQQAGDRRGTASSLAAAKEAALSVADPASQSNTLNYVAAACVRLDAPSDDVKLLLKESAKAIERIEDAGAKVLPLADLAAATSLHLKNSDAALAHLQTAEQAAGQIELPPSRVQAWGRIAGAYGAIGQDAQADRVMSMAQTYADEQSEARARADCLAEIGAAWHALNRSEPSQTAFTAAQQAAATIEEAQSQAYALLHIAQKEAAARQKGEAKKLLLAAQDVALKVKDSSIRGPLVEEIDAALKKL